MLKDDSRKVVKGDTFIALGNGKNFVMDAINNGATKVIVEEGLYNVDTLKVDNTHDYLIKYLSDNYKFNFKLIGITGTNGKTTACYLIYQLLNKLGYKCGYIGTIGFYNKDGFVSNLNNTTPEILELYNLLTECNDYDYVVMEVSSQALSYKRVGNLMYDYTIFTNLTRDHLDYHKTFENYIFAKQELFKKTKKGGYSIINADDSNKNYFILNDDYITYGINSKDIKLKDYELEDKGVKFNIEYKDSQYSFESKLLGLYNIYNLLVCISLAFLEGFTYDEIYEYIKELDAPIGRMEVYYLGNNKIIVDFAHTPDAMEKIINTVSELNHNRIITIIGCGGDRDKTKRPIMGRLATNLSDYTIFTNDNPRNEKPEDIVNDMLSDVSNKNYIVNLDRKEAIHKGIDMLLDKDILLVLGKGHEKYQILGDTKVHFSDCEEIIKYIEK